MHMTSRSKSCSSKKRGLSLSSDHRMPQHQKQYQHLQQQLYQSPSPQIPKVIYNRLAPSRVRITGAPKLYPMSQTQCLVSNNNYKITFGPNHQQIPFNTFSHPPSAISHYIPPSNPQHPHNSCQFKPQQTFINTVKKSQKQFLLTQLSKSSTKIAQKQQELNTIIVQTKKQANYNEYSIITNENNSNKQQKQTIYKKLFADEISPLKNPSQFKELLKVQIYKLNNKDSMIAKSKSKSKNKEKNNMPIVEQQQNEAQRQISNFAIDSEFGQLKDNKNISNIISNSNKKDKKINIEKENISYHIQNNNAIKQQRVQKTNKISAFRNNRHLNSKTLHFDVKVLDQLENRVDRLIGMTSTH